MLKTQSLKLLIQTGEVCKCLRAKTLFYDTGELGNPEENNPTIDVFWNERAVLVRADAGIAGTGRENRVD